ncbi:MAG: MFS transporter [Deltaproteobacteria bacterium]|nr:MFS transporter [Deltaproteobacteria bacterium]
MSQLYPLQYVFLSSFSVLFFEILLLRIFSIQLSYHFASFIIGISVFGIVIGSLCVYNLNKKLKISIHGAFFTLSVSFPFQLLISSFIPFDHYQILWDKFQYLYLLVQIITVIIPFFFYGFFISLCFREFSEISGKIYGTDLLGGALGALSAPLALDFLHPEISLGVIFALLSSASFHLVRNFRSVPAKLVYLFSIFLSVLVLLGQIKIPISEYKSLSALLRMPETKTLKTIISRDSRLDVVENKLLRYGPGLSFSYAGRTPSGVVVARDGEVTGIFLSEGEKELSSYLQFLPSYAPHVLKTRPESILVVGLKSSLEALIAFNAKPQTLVILEKDRSLTRFIDDFYPKDSVYRKFLHRQTVRKFLEKSTSKFDLIIISRTYYFPSGNFGLEEDYETTVDALTRYLESLNQDGILFIQIFRVPPPRYELRLMNNIMQALSTSNLLPLEKHLIVFLTFDTISFMIKKNGYSSKELQAISLFLDKRIFQPIYPKNLVKYVHIEATGIQEAFDDLLASHRTKFVKNYPFDISITIDERPFFHYFLKLSKIPEIHRLTKKGCSYFIHEGMALPFLFFVLLTLTFFSFSPIIVKSFARIPQKKDLFIYFSCCGFGFMFVEVYFIHRLILTLGSPIDAFSAVVTLFLFTAGLGSLLSSRIKEKRLIPFMSLVLLFLLTIYLAKPKGAHTFFVMIFPGFSMGLFFPTGMRILCRNNPDLLPYSYAINGASSVVAPPLASLIAVYFSLSTVIFVSVVCYTIATLVIGRYIIRPYPHLFL